MNSHFQIQSLSSTTCPFINLTAFGKSLRTVVHALSTSLHTRQTSILLSWHFRPSNNGCVRTVIALTRSSSLTTVPYITFSGRLSIQSRWSKQGADRGVSFFGNHHHKVASL